MTVLYLKLKQVLLRGWIVAVCGLIGLLAAGALALATPQTYSATTTLFIGSPRSADSAGALQGDSFSQQRAMTYAQLLTGDAMAVKVRDDLGLSLSPNELSSAVTATPIEKTVLLDLTVTGDSAQGAADIANAYASNFAKYVGQLEQPNGGGAPNALVSVVGMADPTEAVVGVNPFMNMVLGLLAGSGIGVAVWWFLRRLDNSIRTADELETAAGAPVVGTLPAASSQRTGALDFSADSDSSFAEAARKLRTNVEFMNVDAKPRTLVIASPSSGEGAEEVAASLALALGESNHRVVLVDADLRQCALATYLGVSSTDGLSDVLNGTADIAAVELELADRRIVLVPAGTRRNGSVDDLASPLMTDVLMDLSVRFEYVILLAPAISYFADAASIAARVDTALLVGRREFSTTATVARAAAVLRSAGGRVMGSVLVGVKLPRSSEANRGATTPNTDAVSQDDRPTNSAPEPHVRGAVAESSASPDVSQTSHWPPPGKATNIVSELSDVEEKSAVADTPAPAGRVRAGRSLPSTTIQSDPRGPESAIESSEVSDHWSPAESLARYTRSDIDPPTIAIRRDQLAEARPTANATPTGAQKSVHVAAVSESALPVSKVTNDSALVSDE